MTGLNGLAARTGAASFGDLAAQNCFVLIDRHARDGGFHLVRDRRGGQHAACWNHDLQAWCYGNGSIVVGEIVEYCVRSDRGAAQPSESVRP